MYNHSRVNLCIVCTHQEAALSLIDVFRNTEVEITVADLIDVAEDTIVSPANSFGYLDGGIDRRYREVFGPKLEQDLLDALARIGGVLPIGTALTLPVSSHSQIGRIIFAPTVENPEAVRAVNVFRAARAVFREVDRLEERGTPVGELFMPFLGTGVGQVPFNEAAAEMRLAWDRWRE